MPNRAARVAVWLLVALIALAAGAAQRQRQRFLTRGIEQLLPAPVAHAGARLGVNVRLDAVAADERAAQLAAIAAVPAIEGIKQPFFFSPSFDWPTADAIVAAVAAHDLTLVALLDGDPATDFTPPAAADFAAWAGAFATRYGDQIDAYIIWDEPNLAARWGGQKANPDAYAALLNAAAAAIRAADGGAVIVAAPLAPTTETDSVNLADPLYLQALYEAEADFDVVAAKPYGFDTPPDDRRVALDVLNFSRAILLRETMLRNGDAGHALWAANWGWNALPADWDGPPSIWGAVTPDQQAAWTAAALERARREWTWIGWLFLENWQPAAPADDPRWGFSVATRPFVAALPAPPTLAMPGFHLAADGAPGQLYAGDWEFSPQFGADSSEKYRENGDTLDRLTLHFWGTDIGLRVRRADFRARYYVTVDGQPANARPRDEVGSTVVLDAPNPNEDYITIEPVATGLSPGPHTLELVAYRGWDQWALNGFSVGYTPPRVRLPLLWGSGAIALLALLLALRAAVGGPHTSWRTDWAATARRLRALTDRAQLALFAAVGALLTLSGWLTWGQSAAGAFRRLGDGSQLAATVATAVVFYVTPTFFVYALALVGLILLISFRPAWGLALVALVIPFYARAELLKPMFSSYRFSPTELFTLAALVGTLLALAMQQAHTCRPLRVRLQTADWAVLALVIVATLSLWFTERRDVALNEWRTVIVGAALFYALLRAIPLTRGERWVIVDAFVLSGVIVALYGLAQLLFGFQDLITAEGGARRIQSIYGSPNNVALYLGRIEPLLLAVALFSRQVAPRRRALYALAALICGVTLVLTLSKGGLFVGVPFALLALLLYWLYETRRPLLPWLLTVGALGSAALIAALQIPPLAARLDLFGETSFVRVNLWRASLEMVREHPWFGVGLDNFLYAHRGRYIFAAAWREPNLNHPHNLVFDFATRLGLLGLAAGLALFAALARAGWRAVRRTDLPAAWRPVAVGVVGATAHLLAHGLVDHSFFLVDLAYSALLLLALALWLADGAPAQATWPPAAALDKPHGASKINPNSMTE